jgi:chromosomal replication initiator protein
MAESGVLKLINMNANILKRSNTIRLNQSRRIIFKKYQKAIHIKGEPVDIDYIQKVVCNYFNLNIHQLHENNRKREIVQARQFAMYFAHNFTRLSWSKIGQLIGNKDHATAMHGWKTINNLTKNNKEIRTINKQLQLRLN